jgi:glycosyltransferase involved in cell wall biosynthesis
MSSKTSSKTLLIIGYVWPEPNSSAAGTRMMQLIALFQTQGYSITFASPSNLGEHKADLLSLGIHEQLIELNNESFDLFIQQLQPGLVIFDRFMMEEQFGWRIEKQAPQAIRILNTEDLHSLRAVRQQMIKDYLNTQPEMTDLQKVPLHDMQILFDKMSASDLAKREIASLFRCDLTLMISEFEMALLQQQFQVPTRQLIYLPFLYEKIPTSPLTTFEERQNFIAIGNFRHEPNWDAVLWLKQEIWPQIRQQLPQAELHIYGAYPPKKATQLHNPQQGFKVMGWAENAFDVLSQSRVCLAPLRFGAGIKGKLAEAMLCGTPNVTTSIGSESMQIENSETWGGVIADQSHDFAEQAIRLYQDPALWQKAQNQGYAIVTDRYLQTPEKSRLLLDKIHELTTDLASHRTANFMGAMLNHHHHKSTQYMAQWIEAKNRLE